MAVAASSVYCFWLKGVSGWGRKKNRAWSLPQAMWAWPVHLSCYSAAMVSALFHPLDSSKNCRWIRYYFWYVQCNINFQGKKRGNFNLMKTHRVLVGSAYQALIPFSFKVSAKLIWLFEILPPSSLLFMKQIAVCCTGQCSEYFFIPPACDSWGWDKSVFHCSGIPSAVNLQ